MRRFSSRFIVILGLVFGLSQPGRLARAQDEIESEEEQPAQQQRRAVFASDQQFEQWFEQWFWGRGRRADDVRKELEAGLSTKLRELDRMYGLLPEQRRKLEVAGNHDIRRLFDSVRENKEKLDRARWDRNEFIKLFQDLGPRQRQMTSQAEKTLGETSLIEKTLRSTLTREQIVKHAKDVYQSRVHRVVSSYRGRLGLSEEQSRRLIKLIVEETPSLERYGEYDAYAMMFQASKLPEDRFKLILDEGQLRLLRDKFIEARAYEKVLVADGYLAREVPDANHPSAAENPLRKVMDGRPADRRMRPTVED